MPKSQIALRIEPLTQIATCNRVVPKTASLFLYFALALSVPLHLTFEQFSKELSLSLSLLVMEVLY